VKPGWAPELLSWLGDQAGYAYCTARKLKNVRPDPRRLLGNASTLVVDALDELSVRGEGDAVDLVLQWQRAGRLTSRSSGFAPTADDVIELLGAVDPLSGMMRNGAISCC
jgi:hypothetical protein